MCTFEPAQMEALPPPDAPLPAVSRRFSFTLLLTLAAAILILCGVFSPTDPVPGEHVGAHGVKSSSCSVLPPTTGAAVYWPARRTAKRVPKVSKHHPDEVWRLYHCVGSVGVPLTAPVPASARPHCANCDGAVIVKRLIGCPATAACGGLRGCEYTGSNRSMPQCAGIGPVGSANCPPLSPRPLTAGASPAALDVLRELGPDELLVTLEGPQVATLHGVHVGGCEYVFPYSLLIPGVYRLNVLALRADWDALDETTPEFPQMTQDNVGGERLFLSIGNASLAEVGRRAVLDAHDASLPGALPACSSGVGGVDPAVHGAWVRSVSTINMFASRRITPPMDKRFRPRHYMLQYNTHYPSELTWAPYTCTSGSWLTARTAKRCFSRIGKVHSASARDKAGTPITANLPLTPPPPHTHTPLSSR